MKMFQYFLPLLVPLSLILISVSVHAQDDQSGFISIDCGIDKGTTYTDNVTGINYVSDADFIDSGEIQKILPIYNSFDVDTQLTTLTSFPQNTRNCYTLKPAKGKGYNYLIRARFMYGNYDIKSQLPEFDIYLGPDYWDTVKFNSSSAPVNMEIIHLSSSDYIHVCLVNTGRGTPFISVIELRLLGGEMYKETDSGSLYLFARVNFGTVLETVRYKDDPYDRIWSPISWPNSTLLYTLDDVSSMSSIDPPSTVMSTAIIPKYPKESFTINWSPDNVTDKFLIYMHFAEIQILKRNQTREFNVYLNGGLWYRRPVTLLNHTATTLYSTEAETAAPKYTLTLNKTKSSTLPPIINALELYNLLKLPQRQTADGDADAIWSIKSTYRISRHWQGDPCVPKEYVWDGLGCSYNDTDSPRITFLNLSAYGLNGGIDPGFANLTMLGTLDLSNNNLTGTVPNFLSGLNFLKILNLNGNNFVGPIPAELLTKSNKGLLSLSYDEESTGGTVSSCDNGRCKDTKDNKIIVPVTAAAASLFVILAAVTVIWVITQRRARDKRRTGTGLDIKKREYTYSEIQSITSNFNVVLGKGGFGTVYLGYIDDTEVAVKMLSESSLQGDKEFQAEVAMTNVDKENLPNNDSQFDINIQKQKRKEYNRASYLRRKENSKMRRTDNGEGNSQNVTNMTNTSRRDTLLVDITNASPVSVLDIAQRKSDYNRSYYQQRKERNVLPTPIDPSSQISIDMQNTFTDEFFDEGNVNSSVEEETINQCQTSTGSNGTNVDPTVQHHITQEDPFDIVYDSIPTEHRVLKAQNPCNYCGATRFEFEFPTFCCMSGKTKMAYSSIPEELHKLFTEQSALGKMFRRKIRAYNTNFSFASMGVKLDKDLASMRSGVYTFCANGAIYHSIDQLIPRDGHPKYLQLYFYDAETELSHRLQMDNADQQIIQTLTSVLATNPYVQTFRRLAELGPLDNYRVTLNASVELDQRVYNRPTTSEVAGIWVEGNDDITSYKRSIIVYARSNKAQTIQSYWGCYDPLSYPLFFPNGESGWHSKIPRHGFSIDELTNDDEHIDDYLDDTNTRGRRNTVTMREYYCYKFQIRSTQNVILLGGRLLQQFVVDTYIKLETSCLDFCRKNQSRIRADLYQGVVDCVNAGEVRPSMIGQRVVLPASFIGGPRDMRRRFLDAMTLVQDGGKPDIFLTMTCNPNWPEIKNELLPGQTSQDRPDLVTRVFRAKLEDLKKQLFVKHVLGDVGAYVYVIEFQKRGLPHAHFLLIMRPEYKLTNPDHYDKIVCAEIPNPTKYPKLHELVVSNMMHGPCGSLNLKNSCMENDKKICRFRYPRQFNEMTSQGNDSYPLYRRRNNGRNVKVGMHMMDNRWVVPYNPKLLMMFNCHLNVEVCSSITSVKYLFKYIYKGHDKQVIHIDPDGEHVAIDEIKRFQDARYVSPPEAIWRIFSFPLSQIHPFVMALQLHLPDKQMVRFSDDDTLTSIIERERDKRSMLTAFFEINKVSVTARQIFYKDFPKDFTWNPSSRHWNIRKKGSMVGRLVSANPAEGERYYLRLLLTHVRGPTSFDDLYTVNNVRHPTFRKAALELGLIESDDCLSQCLTEASLFQFPGALRRLFATILVFCEPGDVRKLWDDHYDALSEDYMRQYGSVDRVQNMVLTDIMVFLQSMSKNLDEFDLPNLNRNIEIQSGNFREVQEECSIVVESEHLSAPNFLNPEQKNAYDEIMRHVHTECPGVFFVDGPGGTGKTFLYKALLANIRSHGHIALATASSGVAANNMPGGRTAHSRFKIPLNLDNNSVCNIRKQSGAAELLRIAKVIIWDEASMAKRHAVEAVDRTLQDITGVRLPFGGKIMILGGDFRQVLPVVRRGTRAQIVDSSLRMSPLWSSITKLRLTINMRARTDPWFSEFLLRVGDGVEETMDGSYIRIPDDMVIRYTDKEKSLKALIDATYPSLQINRSDAEYITSRAILTTKNNNVDEINDYLIERFDGEQKVYYSFDEAEDDKNNFYPVEFLNSLSVSGLPPHYLRLKVGCPIILLRNIDPSNGLCNGTRLICRSFQPNVIDAEIALGQHAGKRIFLPRISLCPSDEAMFPFKLKRKQFPIRLCFAMTVNKAQGQTIPNVGIYLPESVFSHGQLYVALSRGTSRRSTKVLVQPEKQFSQPGVHTLNVVYKEVLQDK